MEANVEVLRKYRNLFCLGESREGVGDEKSESEQPLNRASSDLGKLKSIRFDKHPWCDRVFAKSYTEIECDPSVRNIVESRMLAKSPMATPSRLRSGPHQ
jgi:hypothetical protein